MSPLWGNAVGVFIVVMMLAFIAMWIWLWMPRHKRKHNWLARLPMEDNATQAGHEIPPTDEEERR